MSARLGDQQQWTSIQDCVHQARVLKAVSSKTSQRERVYTASIDCSRKRVDALRLVGGVGCLSRDGTPESVRLPVHSLTEVRLLHAQLGLDRQLASASLLSGH